MAAAGLTAGLLAAATGPASAAGAGATAQLVAGGNVAVGQVLNNGAAVAGASVLPVAWPNDTVLHGLADGAQVPELALPTVTTDVNGNFAVPLSISSVPANYLDSKGRPNIELRVTSGAKQASWQWTAAKTATGWTTADAANNSETSSKAPETLILDLGAATVAEVTGAQAVAFQSHKMTGKVSVSKLGVKTAPSDVATPNGAATPPPCYYYAGAWFTNRVEPFAHVYPGKTAAATIYQRLGVDHTIGIASSYSGHWLGGHAGGTHTISLAASGSKRLLANSTAFNSLNLRRYDSVCYGGKVQADGVYAILSRIDAAAEPNWTACAIYGPGFTLTKYRGTNITFGSQVNVGIISVDAQSGWTTDTEITWVTGGTRNSLCGSSSLGWVTSAQAEANSA